MSKKNEDLKNKLSQDEIDLFHHAVKHVRPLQHDKILLRTQRPKQKKSSPTPPVKQDSFIYLSEHNSNVNLTADATVLYARPSISPKQIRKLKQGKLFIAAKLDLHNCTIEIAKQQLSNFLQQSLVRRRRCVLIIHGKGHQDQPILKNKLNNWLRQMDMVLAFCTAISKHGGTGAMYVLLKSAM
jgi:DNA-nicking Smr family endonuclease